MPAVPTGRLFVAMRHSTERRLAKPPAGKLDAVRKALRREPRGEADRRRAREVHRQREIRAPRRGLAPDRVVGGHWGDVDFPRDRKRRRSAGRAGHHIHRLEHGADLRGNLRARLARRGQSLWLSLQSAFFGSVNWLTAYVVPRGTI